MCFMEKEEVETTIKKINNYLQNCMSMDFTLAETNCGNIVIFGAIDQTWNNYVDNYENKIEMVKLSGAYVGKDI